MKCRYPFTAFVMTTGVALSLFLCVSGCKKEEESGREYIISGTVYYDCARVPYAHRQLELVHYTNTATLFYEPSRAFTDAFGRFKFTYSETPGSASFTDEYQIFIASGDETGRLLMSRIPGKQSVAAGELYANNKIRLFVSVETGNKLYPGDTLFFGLSATDYHAIYPVAALEGEFEFNANARIYSSVNLFNTNSFTYALGYEAYSKTFQSAAAGKSQVLSNADCNARRVVDTVQVSL